MKRTIIAISIILVIFIAATLGVSYATINSNEYLKSFKIISVSNVTTKFNIKFEKVKAAKEYEVFVYNDTDNTIIYDEKTEDNDLNIDLSDIKYNTKYRIEILAYDNKGESKKVKNPYVFVYNEPTFSKENKLLLNNNEDYVLKIDGDLSKKNYYISIESFDKTIKKERLTSNEYVILNSIFRDKSQVFNINIFDNNDVISKISLYSNMSPVSDVYIVSPKNDSFVDLGDITLKYRGGDNATSYLLQIYNDSNLLKEITIKQKEVIISSEFFKRGEGYKIVINALYDEINEYSKTASVNFDIKEEE